MLSGTVTAILIGVIAVGVVGAAGTLLLIDNDGEELTDGPSFTVTYYKNGNKLSDIKVLAGTSVMIMGDTGISGRSERFIGWNTAPDMSGAILLPGTQITVDRSLSLYAVTMSTGMYAIVLPEKQIGYTMTADPMLVNWGGASIISFSLLPSHIEEDLVIAINGNPMKLNALKEIHLTDITEDKIVTVTGVFDKREHSISLPADQRGYVLTSSAETVHHGESYTLGYTLLPGYMETSGFGICLNGGDVKQPSGGTLLIEDVRDNHRITVTGVEPIQYNISSGKNVSALVNGASVTKATVEDLITIRPAAEYSLPDTFNSNIKGKFTIESKGYRISDNIVLPSISKVTAGDNVRMNGSSLKAIFVCPEDKVKITSSPGYVMPDDYNDKAKGLKGATYSAQGFSFSEDTVLPSIFKVVFNGYNKPHATFFVVGGTAVPLPQNSPLSDLYHFDKWQIDIDYIMSDVQIYAKWLPN
ncbi:MAG: InlB B-repeat-containing protein, partial [Candidatus Methanoplasma sp.]|nr:InlB B-repeat-containing protein [Candidatus Methanoplasma sp.]